MKIITTFISGILKNIFTPNYHPRIPDDELKKNFQYVQEQCKNW